MAESYSLEAILSARDTNFTSTMDNAQKSMGGLSKSASGIGASVGKIAAGFGVFKAISGTIKVLSSSISSLAGELNESSMAWQTFESNMTMLGKSSGEIDSVRKSLQDFATQTIYSASDMAQTYGQMAAIGVEDTEKLVKAMGGLAASAENPQQAMKTMSQQMTQAMTKPTLSWADFKLMLEQTPAGMAEVAKEMGYALEDFVGAVQDGEIASKDFAKAVSEVGTNEHFSAMATEFKSVGQAMDGARETIANKLMPAFEMLSAIGIKAISSLTDWIDTLDFSGLLAPIESLASMFGIATDEITAMTDTIKMSSDEIQTVADNWETMSLSEKQATVQTMGQEDLSELLDMLGVDFESIPDEYTKDAFLNAHGKDALEELLWVTGEWHNLTLEEKQAVLEAQIDNKGLEEAIDNMKLWENTEFMSKFADINMNDNDSEQQVLDLINSYRELEGLDPIEIPVDIETKHAIRDIKGVRKSLKQFNKSLGPIGKMFDELSETQAEFWGDMSVVAKDGLKGMVDVAKSAFKGDWKGAWDTFKDTSMTALEGTGNAIGKLLEGQFKAIGNMMKNTDWSQVFTTMGNAMQGAVNFIGDIGTKIFTWLSEKLGSVNWTELGQTIMTAIGSAISSAVELIGDIGTSIKDWVFRSFGVLTWGDLATTIFSRIGDALSTAVTTAVDLSSTFLTWLTNAINGVEWSQLGTTAGELIAGAINGIADWDITIDSGFVTKVGEAVQSALDGLDELIEGFLESIAQNVDWSKVLPEVRMGDMTLNWDNLFGNIGGSFSSWDALLFGTGVDSKPVFEVDAEVEVNGTVTDVNIDSGREGGGREVQLDTPIPAKGDVNFEPAGVNIGRGEGGAGAIGSMIEDEIKGQAPSEVTTNTNVNPQTTLTDEISGGGIAEKITSFIQSLAPKTVSPQVSVQPITTGGTGSTEAPQVDFSGMIADAQSAMQQVNQAITTGMTNVTSAVRMGTVMMNVAFRSGMNQAIITAQNTANRVVSAFSNLSSRLHSAGVMAGAGFRNGLASQAGSIISTAQSIANSVSSTIQSALRIASPSKVTTYLGEMVGEGLIVGMDGMVSGVESSANRLSLATLPTTDLGNSRYGGSISGTSTSSKLDEVIDAINRGQVIMLDSGALVGETSQQMDMALGQRGSLGGRHKL